MATPVWKDYILDYDGSEYPSIEFSLRVGSSSDPFYTGKAFPNPATDFINVRVNDLCRDYLSQSLPSPDSWAEFTETEETALAERTFHYSDNAAAHDAEITFRMDYSYEGMPENYLSKPITGEVDNGHPLILTLSGIAPAATLLFNDGSTTSVDLGGAVEGCKNYALNLANHPGLVKVTIGDLVYNVVPADRLADFNDDYDASFLIADTKTLKSCCRYALYYVNAHGGWDSLLVKGSAKQTDNYTRGTYRTTCVNGQAATLQRGKVNNVNAISRKFVLNTGWLGDGSCAKMHHLLGSTQVYLYDVVDHLMIPVVLTDTSCEYKSYRTNGDKLCSYSINAEVAADMERR